MTDLFESQTMRLSDAITILGISRNTGYRLAKEDGKLAEGVPVLRVSGRYVVPTEPLLRAITTPDDAEEARLAAITLAADVLDTAADQLHALAAMVRGNGARALVEQAGLLPAVERAARRIERESNGHD
jgi:hypothetical protein